jgi:hypothetical protein
MMVPTAKNRVLRSCALAVTLQVALRARQAEGSCGADAKLDLQAMGAFLPASPRLRASSYEGAFLRALWFQGALRRFGRAVCCAHVSASVGHRHTQSCPRSEDCA